MFCPKCNFNNRPEARFCADCGFALHTIAVEEKPVIQDDKQTSKKEPKLSGVPPNVNESNFWTKTRSPKNLFTIISVIIAGVLFVPSIILGIIGAVKQQPQTPPPPPQTCQNSKATNFGNTLPCVYPIPSTPEPSPKTTPPAPTTQLPPSKTTPAPAPSNNDDLVKIINQWRSRIAYVECEWQNVNNQIARVASGSGLLYTAIPNSPYVVTNSHVLVYDLYGKKYGAYSCKVILPTLKEPIIVPQADLGANPEVDWGLLWLNNINQDITDLSKSYYKTCITGSNNKVALGEKVIILGYPGIGSHNDITVTDGIISGYEGDYYITTAKIEHGDSGGAAILVKGNCYLGIPSYAVTGEIESLGRILDINAAFERMTANLNQ